MTTPCCSPHHRRPIRLPGYDYAQAGRYFVTICVQGGECRFGEIVAEEMQLNDAGRMVQATWQQLPERFPMVQLDTYVVMPNHFHAIVVMTDPDPGSVGAPLVGAPLGGASEPGGHANGHHEPRDGYAPEPGGHKGRPYKPPKGKAFESTRPTLGDIVGAFKSLTTNAYIVGVRQTGWPPFDGRLWQRGYWEHVIRHERALERIREYILGNPQRWEWDRENPHRRGNDSRPCTPTPTAR